MKMLVVEGEAMSIEKWHLRAWRDPTIVHDPLMLALILLVSAAFLRVVGASWSTILILGVLFLVVHCGARLIDLLSYFPKGAHASALGAIGQSCEIRRFAKRVPALRGQTARYRRLVTGDQILSLVVIAAFTPIAKTALELPWESVCIGVIAAALVVTIQVVHVRECAHVGPGRLTWYRYGRMLSEVPLGEARVQVDFTRDQLLIETGDRTTAVQLLGLISPHEFAAHVVAASAENLST